MPGSKKRRRGRIPGAAPVSYAPPKPPTGWFNLFGRSAWYAIGGVVMFIFSSWVFWWQLKRTFHTVVTGSNCYGRGGCSYLMTTPFSYIAFLIGNIAILIFFWGFIYASYHLIFNKEPRPPNK